MAGAPKKERVDRGIYKLRPGLYEVAVSAGKQPDGTYRQVFRRHRGTLNTARDARRLLLGEVERGEHTGAGATLDELFDAWLLALGRLRRAPKTIQGYRNDARTYWRGPLGKKRVTKIARSEVKAVLDALIDRGLAPSTIDHAHACISAAFSWAVRADWVARDVTKNIELPELARGRPLVPTPADVAAVLRAAATSERPEMERFGWLGAITGARSSELRALRLSVLHLEEGRLGIDRALSAEVEWVPKNKRYRDVGLDEITVAVVEDQLEFMRKRAVDGDVELDADAFLFSDDQAGRRPWREDMVSHWWSALFDAAGKPDDWPDEEPGPLGRFTFKHLRKFMDTHGQELGFTVDDVADRAGHTAEVARRHYSGARASTDRRLSAALAGVLDALQRAPIEVQAAPIT